MIIFMKEIWIDIKGFEGYYKVSNYGRVKSCSRLRKSKYGSLCHVEERILSQRSDKDGYKEVALSMDGKLYYFRVHRLVASAFIPNPKNLPYINHKDEIKYNNVVDNLEWCDNSYNVRYSIYKISFKVKCNGIVYPSIRALARALKTDASGISYRINKGGLFKRKYKIELVK